MIDIEIPTEYIEAWQWAYNTQGKWCYIAQLQDALVWAIAGWAEEKFYSWYRHHRDESYCHTCQMGQPDMRHSLTPDQWRDAVRAKLEAK